MAVEVLVLKEVAAGEKRVAATPETVKKLVATGAQVRVEPGAGLGAGVTDAAYVAAGAQLAGGDARAAAQLAQHVDEQEQPQPAARPPLGRAIGLAEAFEHLRFESRAAIGDLEHQHVLFARCGDADPGGRRLRRIVDHIADHLTERRIGNDRHIVAELVGIVERAGQAACPPFGHDIAEKGAHRRHLRSNAARFARTLSILAASAVPVLEALRISAEVVTNAPMRRAVEDAAVRVREGAPIARSIGASKLFPPMLVHLVASGETSGELEAMLERAADNQERELDGVVNTAVGILGPVMILLMGGFVFVIVVALLLPIFQLNQAVR